MDACSFATGSRVRQKVICKMLWIQRVHISFRQAGGRPHFHEAHLNMPQHERIYLGIFAPVTRTAPIYMLAL